MYNVKQYKDLMKYIKEKGKNNSKENRWEFALFLTVLMREKISCIEALKFLFDYAQEVAPAEKKFNEKDLAEKFRKVGSYGKIAKEEGLSYNTVRQKVENFNEVEGFVNKDIDSDLVEKIDKKIKNTDLSIEEMLYPEMLKGKMQKYFENEIYTLEYLENNIKQTIERNRSSKSINRGDVWEEDTEVEVGWEEESEKYNSKEDDTEWIDEWEEEL